MREKKKHVPRQKLMVTEVRIVVSSRRGIFGWEATKRAFWSLGNVLCLDLADNYTDVYTDNTILFCTLNVHALTVYKLHTLSL